MQEKHIRCHGSARSV